MNINTLVMIGGTYRKELYGFRLSSGRMIIVDRGEEGKDEIKYDVQNNLVWIQQPVQTGAGNQIPTIRSVDAKDIKEILFSLSDPETEMPDILAKLEKPNVI